MIEFTHESQVRDLLEMFGGEKEASITVTKLDCGNAGPGLYASYTEYPEEGSIYLGECEEEADSAPVAHQWEDDKCTRCGAYRTLHDDTYFYGVNGYTFGTSAPDCLIEFKEASDAELERIKRHGLKQKDQES